MTAMIEPMAAGGKLISTHLVPIILTRNAKKMNRRPKTMKPDWASV